jgi:hypothetical protein
MARAKPGKESAQRVLVRVVDCEDQRFVYLFFSGLEVVFRRDSKETSGSWSNNPSVPTIVRQSRSERLLSNPIRARL